MRCTLGIPCEQSSIALTTSLLNITIQKCEMILENWKMVGHPMRFKERIKMTHSFLGSEFSSLKLCQRARSPFGYDENILTGVRFNIHLSPQVNHPFIPALWSWRRW